MQPTSTIQLPSSSLKVISFNINSIKAHWHQLEACVKEQNPDIIALQETKVTDNNFPLDSCHNLGFDYVFFHGEKTHRGVALLSKIPIVNFQKGFIEEDTRFFQELNSQTRLLSGDIVTTSGKKIHFINGYFPQGENRSHPDKFPFKVKFYDAVEKHINTAMGKNSSYMIVVGDMNIAPGDIDIGIGEKNKKRWLKEGKCSFLPEEREMLQKIMHNLIDTYRFHQPGGKLLSWFDYRSRGFESVDKRGLRIDLILSSESLKDYITKTGISYDIRAMEKPSDHAPIWTHFNIK